MVMIYAQVKCYKIMRHNMRLFCNKIYRTHNTVHLRTGYTEI
uniref:Uncharacterized protein n=1 Tax=Anguilla anguilla TaxID=7936 RepID=A0A0E9W8G5_ANGAN